MAQPRSMSRIYRCLAYLLYADLDDRVMKKTGRSRYKIHTVSFAQSLYFDVHRIRKVFEDLVKDGYLKDLEISTGYLEFTLKKPRRP